MGQSTIPLTIRLFGGFTAQIHGDPLPSLRSRREKWLLALLVLERGREVARPKLAQTLWPFPDHSADQAAYNLRRSLSELRKALGTEEARLISPTPRTLRFDLSGADVDIIDFDLAIASGDPAALERATQLYRGPLLPECTEVWALGERTQREQQYLQALEDLAARATARGDLAAAIATLRRCLSVDPLREGACRSLMEALAGNGEGNSALQVYQQLSRLLHRTQNAVPTPETGEVFNRIRAELRSGLRNARHRQESPSTSAAALHLLPTPLTSLVGREEQTRAIAAQLGGARLLTLTGSGGVGKTRLAIQIAQEATDGFRDGIYFVNLSALTDLSLVVQTTASVLDVREEAGVSLLRSLVEVLRRREVLLVLDGCEHLLPACCDMVETLLPDCLHLRILATSRQALGVQGESIWRVPSLSLPDPRRLPLDDRHLPALLTDYAAIRLFVERARLVQADFALTPDNARAVLQICLRLDGIPLAIELAAARIKALPVEQIARRFNQLFRLLTGGPRSALSRQQTLEATIKWSYDLLTTDERALLARLSVFSGGWTIEAAEEIAGRPHETLPLTGYGRAVIDDNVVDLISQLVDRSLVLFEEQDGQGRYRMLEAVRHYAQERLRELHEEDAVGARHLDFYLRLAETAEPTLFGPHAADWLPYLETEHDNLRAALEWALARVEHVAAALRLSAALWRFWYRHAYLSEGRNWLTTVLARETGQEIAAVRARACNGAGFLAFHQGDTSAARALLAEAQGIAENLKDDRLLASTLHSQGYMAWYLNDCTTARRYYEQALHIYRLVGATAEVAGTLSQLGIVTGDLGDVATANAHFTESLALAHELGDRALIATTLHSQAHLAFYQRDYPAAQTLYENALVLGREQNDTTRIVTALHRLGTVAEAVGEIPTAHRYFAESLTLARKMDEKSFIAAALHGLGSALASLGEYGQALTHVRECLLTYQELQDKRGMAQALDLFARIALAQHDAVRAATLLGSVDAIRMLLGLSPRPLDDDLATATRAPLGQAEFTTALRLGRSLSADDILRYAISG